MKGCEHVGSSLRVSTTLRNKRIGTTEQLMTAYDGDDYVIAVIENIGTRYTMIDVRTIHAL